MVFRSKKFCKNLKPTGTSNCLVLLIAARKVGSYRDTDLNFKVDYGLVININKKSLSCPVPFEAVS